MKNLLFILFILIGFSACNNNSHKSNSEERNIQLLTDSTAYHNDLLSDTSITMNSEQIEEKYPGNAKIPTASSKQKNSAAPITLPNTAVRDTKPIPAPVATSHDSDLNNSGTANTGTVDKSDGPISTSTPQAEQKKGWNKATQGAVIGGAAGAVGGAIISKKKGVGAVVGGIVGAAGGYIIGNKKDKKEKQSEDK
ncbi:MAG: glycine zipper domain-containing protein [Ginsengibacter sp.]